MWYSWRKNTSAASHSVLTPSVNPSTLCLGCLSSNSHAAHRMGVCARAQSQHNTHNEAYYRMLREREGVVLTQKGCGERQFLFPLLFSCSVKSLQDTAPCSVQSILLHSLDYGLAETSDLATVSETFTGRDFPQTRHST